MKVILFGASGMVGQGVLRECLADADVEAVLSVVRTPSGVPQPKLRELAHQDFSDFSTTDLAGYDACFFCLGVSAAGMSEPDYRRITYGFTLAAAERLAKLSPGITFVYVSGAGTDSSEHGRAMWARVKGQTENALLKLLPQAYMFRPGMIEALHGIKSRTRAYRIAYTALSPLIPVIKALWSKQLLTTESVGRAMLNVAKRGASTHVLEIADIKAAASA